MSNTLRLTDEEQAMLGGEAGPGVQKAMEIVAALGQIYGAADLVPVASVQVAGVSYKNLGDAGLEFLQAWAREDPQGTRARVPATLNPAGMDLRTWRELGFPAGFARQQEAIIAAYTALGITPTCTCTPYQVGHVPRFGQHLAWAESSAVSYANSVLGARTNREGGPSALAAAITGRTARYGLHLDENRRATLIVDVHCPMTSEADLGALGYLTGRQVGNGVPYFRFHSLRPADCHLKALGAAMAASGAVALYHVEGMTPEAKDLDPIRAASCSAALCNPVVKRSGQSPSTPLHCGITSSPRDSISHGTPTVVVDDLTPGYAALNGTCEQIDLVSLGCPHASLEELQAIADYLDGRRVKAALWITTAYLTREVGLARGLVERIQAAGARVVADTCMVVAPVAALGFRTMATNSAKMAFYTPSHSGLSVRFGPMEQCLEAAVTGKWTVKRQASI